MWLPIALPSRTRAERRPRIGLHRLPDDEERRVHAFVAQDVENFVGVRRVRTVVVGERDDALVLRSAHQRLAEELAARAFDELVDRESVTPRQMPPRRPPAMPA